MTCIHFRDDEVPECDTLDARRHWVACVLMAQATHGSDRAAILQAAWSEWQRDGGKAAMKAVTRRPPLTPAQTYVLAGVIFAAAGLFLRGIFALLG